jgi:peptidoglycan-associated lipoprotein
MMKKMIFLVALAFTFSSLFMVISCAKKQIGMEETSKPAYWKPEQKPEKDDAEAERQAKLRELERAQKLRDEIQMFENEKIYFDFDRSELKPEAQAVLKKKAQWLRDNPDFSLRIEGHCDERGTNEYNLALGERRANAALKFLNALGISTHRMSTISYGEERPAMQGHNESAWSKNRRDEFKLTK